MEKKCKNCKWWGEKALTMHGVSFPYKECLKTKYGDNEAYVYSIGDAECDEDIDGWEALEQEQVLDKLDEIITDALDKSTD